MSDDGLAKNFDDLRARARRRERRRGGWLSRFFAAILIAAFVLPPAWVLLYRFVEAPGTQLMARRSAEGQTLRRDTVPLRRISPHLVRAVIAAEDAKFCAHDGFDVEAIEDAREYNERQKARGSDRRRGASTISQQTAKNLFLWPDRSYVRKGLEVYFTALIEMMWPKDRIMEAYLNAAEWGGGVFGAEAAAQARFGKSAADLTPREAARLAAVLPSPNKWRADKPGPYVRRRAAAIEQRMRVVQSEGLAACVLGEEKTAAPPPKRSRKEPDPPPTLPDIPAPPPELAPVDELAPLPPVAPPTDDADPLAPPEDAIAPETAPGAEPPPADAPVY